MPSEKPRTYRVTYAVVMDVEARDESEAADRAWDTILDDLDRDDAFIESIEDLGVTCE